MSFFRFKQLYVTFIVIFTGWLFVNPLFAYAFSLEPSSVDLEIASGERVIQTVSIANSDSVYASYLVSLHLVAFDEQGNFREMIELPYDWITATPKTFGLDVGQEQAIDVVFTPPENLFPFSSALAVVVERMSERSDGGVVPAAVSYIFFSHQADQLQAAARINTFTIHKTGDFLSGAVEVENLGQRIITPEGVLTISGMFGQEIGRYAFNNQGSRVPIGSTRILESRFTDTSLFGPWSPGGRIRADLALAYAPGVPVIGSTISWYVWPGWAFLLMLSTALALLVVLVGLVLRRKHAMRV